MPNLVLIGFMGTGKTTIGKLCAAKLGYEFRDSDSVVEAMAGCAIPHLFSTQGEHVFRQLEREAIADLSKTPGLVIATGGGAILDAENAEYLCTKGRVVLLTATPEAILTRVGNARSRPLLASAPDPRARIEELLTERHPHYERAAHYTIHTADRPASEIAAEIVDWFTAQEPTL